MARIIVPTDFSAGALNAAVHAVRLFGAEGNTFILLHAYKLPASDPAATFNLDELLAREALRGSHTFEGAVRERFPGETLHLETICEHGDLPNVIDRFNDDPERPACVVMGTQGASGVKEVLFGSNTAAVIKQCSLPVLAVPTDAAFRAPRRIVLADDGGPVQKPSLSLLLDLARWYHGEVRVTRVVNESVAAASEQEPAYDTILGAIPHTQQFLSADDVEAALNDFAEQGDADLLVVLHRERGIFHGLFQRSMSAKLAMHTHLPLLVLRQAEH